MTITKRHHTAALKFANRERAKLGKRPVKRLQKGDPGKALNCTIARTIDRKGLVCVDEFGATVHLNGRVLLKNRSTLVHDFIQAFDRRKVPELIREGA